jgi:hypothetical protein
MFSALSNPKLILAGIVLALIQVIVALPWLSKLDPKGFRRVFTDPLSLGTALLGVMGAGVLVAAFMAYRSDTSVLEHYGRWYGALLHLQITIDILVLIPGFLLLVWPRGGAVAQAAYREGWRNPVFWLITIAATVLIFVSMVVPYFTMGDDYKMMKQLSFDTVMLSAVLFGVLTAGLSINYEIEDRTALTLMSKPINRRQFLIGKFLGILLACFAMTLLIAWSMTLALEIKPYFDKLDDATDPMPVQMGAVLSPLFQAVVPTPQGDAVARGAAAWCGEGLSHHIGLMLGFGQVTILVAIAAALATRLPFIVNLVIVLVIFFLGHLAPVLVQVSQSMGTQGAGLVGFLAQLFNTILPALEFFNNSPSIIRDAPLDVWSFLKYVLTVYGYAAVYTAIALLVGLILFEDRDLA